MARYLEQILRALDVAHRHSPHPIIHRDIKPSNFVIGRCACSPPDGKEDADPPAPPRDPMLGCARAECAASHAYLIDFGLARRYRMPTAHDATGPGTCARSPGDFVAG
eukprot:gene2448-17911_t